MTTASRNALRKCLPALLAITLAAGLLAAGIATAAKPTVVRAGNLVLKLNGGVSPKRLPKTRMAPITLRISANVSTTDGSHPPAAGQVIADFDRHGTVNARGLPVCRPGRLEARPTAAAKRACPRAIVGTGTTTVRVAFPESRPFSSTGPLVLFNGGVRGGVTKLFIHAYVNVPAPTAVITRVKIRRIRQGRFGTRAIAQIPVIAGGAGSVTRFAMKIQRSFRRGGQRQSYLLARCANGRFVARGKVAFRGGPSVAGTVVRACRPRR